MSYLDRLNAYAGEHIYQDVIHVIEDEAATNIVGKLVCVTNPTRMFIGNDGLAYWYVKPDHRWVILRPAGS